jgi:uncharacterized membrane protein YeaQ/YmgE (transglycosylase-associated protein family)
LDTPFETVVRDSACPGEQGAQVWHNVDREPSTESYSQGAAVMEISGIISAIVIGIVIGVLGRLVVPGRQKIGVLWTIAVGILAAFAGSALANALGVKDTNGIDWIEWLIQIGLAAIGVIALVKLKTGNRSSTRR